MNINISPESEQWVEAQVTGGRFPSCEDVLNSVIDFFRKREALRAAIADPDRYTTEEIEALINKRLEEMREAGEVAF